MAVNTKWTKSGIIVNKNSLPLDKKGMDLEASLFCGQSFSWLSANGIFSAVIDGRGVLACEDEKYIYLLRDDEKPMDGEDKAFWVNYFALDMDYESLHKMFSRDKTLAACVEFNPGLRLLNQPFFETLISFITSQNNNIPRIHTIMNRLRSNFGGKSAGGQPAFPRHRDLKGKTTGDFACLNIGYRDKYLVDAVDKYCGGFLDEKKLRSLPVPEARKVLLEVKGIGPKVADCVLLYSLGAYSVVPMDVWMKRAMESLFGGAMPEAAGPYAGIAQLYIFNYARHCLDRDGNKKE